MITVAPEFAAVQSGDVAQYVKLVYLILGNYASSGAGATVSSNGDDASGNFPAAGAIDGDRTEINVGAPATADNGVGKSSWKAASNPSGGSPNILTIQFGQSRTFNRTKLYNLAANPSTSYVLEYSVDGSTAWTAYAGTPDVYVPPTPPAGSYGWGTPGGWGAGPWGGSTNPYVVTGGLDSFDTIPDITAKAIRLRVFATQSGGPAQVVELEVYRKVDISSRLLGLKIDRKKDFKLSQPIATQLQLDLDNKNQFFSLFYSPTTAQAAAYVNAELAALGLNVEVNEGFVTLNGPQFIRTFTGSVDSIDNNAKPGRATIVARDFMKHLINQFDSCNLKTTIDITNCIQYLLNRNNVSNYEMTLATTTIVLSYFFVYEQAILTTIQQLVQAAGDAIFYFDETGNATFQYYLNATPQGNTVNTQAGWNAGTLYNLDSASVPGQITSAYTITSGSFAWFYSSGSAPYGKGGVVTGGSGAVASELRSFSNQVYGYWKFSMQQSGGATYTDFIYSGGNYYGVSISGTAVVLYKNGVAILTTTGGVFRTDIVVTRTNAGLFTLFVGGVNKGTVTDNTITTCTNFRLRADQFDSAQWYAFFFDPNIAGTNGQDFLPPVWQSPTIDAGPTISAYGTITLTIGGTGPALYRIFTATSPDATTWSPWLEVGAGNAILSPLNRYLKYYVVMTDVIGPPSNFTETIFNATTSWTTGGGQQKWSPTTQFFFTSYTPIKDLQVQVSDNLGGSTAIVNDIAVTSSPLILGGVGTQTMWQAVAGTPPAAVAAGNPMGVGIGVLTFNIAIPGGMDTSAFGGVNTGAGGGGIALTFASSAAGSAQITYVHPTKPVLTLTITHAGTITDLRLIGLSFQSLLTPFQALAVDAASIMKNRRRHVDLNNNYIVSNSVAGIVATKYITNFKAPVLWLPRVDLHPPVLNLQPGDTCNIVEAQTGVNKNFYIIGFSRSIRVDGDRASVAQSLALLPTT